MDAHARLCPDNVLFDMSVYLTHSDVSLDYTDQAISPTGGDTGNSLHSAIRTPYTRSIENVSIHGCQIVNARGYGIDLKRLFRSDEPCLTAPNEREIRVKPGEQYQEALIGHRNIRISEVGIYSPAKIGIYLGQSSRDIEIRDVHIDNAFIGVYLEASSAGTRISCAVITNSFDREAIAVDSSRYNIIEDSVFSRNGSEVHDAINLYKNPGDTHGQVCPVTRPWGSDYNLIRHNDFHMDDVNVASRESKDLYVLCGRYETCSLNYRDHANHNVIAGNVFHSGAQLNVLDSDFVVHGNVLESGSELGGKHHEYNLTGYLAEDNFMSGSTVKLNDGNWSALDVRQKVGNDGVCAPGLISGRNRCDRDRTVLWEKQVVSAGLLVAVL